MNKELEALNDMLEYLLTYDEFNEKRHKDNANIIATALKDYDSLKVKHKRMQDVGYFDDFKRLKAFEIIKEKVQFEFLEEREEGKPIRLYFTIGNRMFSVNQQEYELLKEALL